MATRSGKEKRTKDDILIDGIMDFFLPARFISFSDGPVLKKLFCKLYWEEEDFKAFLSCLRSRSTESYHLSDMSADQIECFLNICFEKANNLIRPYLQKSNGRVTLVSEFMDFINAETTHKPICYIDDEELKQKAGDTCTLQKELICLLLAAPIPLEESIAQVPFKTVIEHLDEDYKMHGDRSASFMVPIVPNFARQLQNSNHEQHHHKCAVDVFGSQSVIHVKILNAFYVFLSLSVMKSCVEEEIKNAEAETQDWKRLVALPSSVDDIVTKMDYLVKTVASMSEEIRSIESKIDKLEASLLTVKEMNAGYCEQVTTLNKNIRLILVAVKPTIAGKIPPKAN